jgi:hypothetical protein
MRPQVIHEHYLSLFRLRSEHLPYVGFEDTGRGCSLYGKRRSHPSYPVMLESSVVFLPRLL